MYTPLPSIYSKELASVLGLLLQVNPNHRPNCDQILTHPSVVKRLDYTKNLSCNEKASLLQTIKLPKNINDINKQLPKGKGYDSGNFEKVDK